MKEYTIVPLTNKRGEISVKELKELLADLPDTCRVSFCGEVNAGAFYNKAGNIILIDDINFLEEEDI